MTTWWQKEVSFRAVIISMAVVVIVFFAVAELVRPEYKMCYGGDLEDFEMFGSVELAEENCNLQGGSMKGFSERIGICDVDNRVG